jgi:hypothetical protein
MMAQTLGGCTKHVLRFYRRPRDDCRNRYAWLLRPRNVSVFSYRPMQRSGSTCRVGQVEPGPGEEPHTRAVGDYRRSTPERERMSNQRAGLRVSRPLRALAFNDAVNAAGSSASGRFMPGVSSEAPSSPATLP